MRKLIVAAAVAALSLAATTAGAGEKKAGGPLESEEARAVYALGATLAEMIQQYDLAPEEVDVLVAGLRDRLLGKELKVDLKAEQAGLRKFGMARQSRVAGKEEAAGKALIEEAARHKNAERTASGMVVETVKEGTGESPGPHDTVKVHYTGTLRDGTVFDSSVERGAPATFPLDRVIPCWTEGLQKMKVGGKAKLYCPASLAYGKQGAPPRIKPGATLVFDVELLDIPDRGEGQGQDGGE